MSPCWCSMQWSPDCWAIQVMERPARSSDLNPNKNVWDLSNKSVLDDPILLTASSTWRMHWGKNGLQSPKARSSISSAAWEVAVGSYSGQKRPYASLNEARMHFLKCWFSASSIFPLQFRGGTDSNCYSTQICGHVGKEKQVRRTCWIATLPVEVKNP